MKAVLLLAAPLLLSACAKQKEPALEPSPPEPLAIAPSAPPPPSSPPPSTTAALAPAPAQAAFEHHCGECHRSDLPTAKPAALAIFDLTQGGWPTRMTEHQLEAATRRMKGVKASDEERRAALSLIDAELARRTGGKSGSL